MGRCCGSVVRALDTGIRGPGLKLGCVLVLEKLLLFTQQEMGTQLFSKIELVKVDGGDIREWHALHFCCTVTG